MSDQLALFDHVAAPPAAPAPRGCTCRPYWAWPGNTCTICKGLFVVNGKHVWSGKPATEEAEGIVPELMRHHLANPNFKAAP